MAAARLMSSDWFHEQHLVPWLPRLCTIALSAADAEATHGDCYGAGMRRMTRKYGVAAYFDGLRTAEENLCLWYREGDGQEGSCAFEYLLACYLLCANTNLGHVVHPDRLGFRPTLDGDTVRVARYMAEALCDSRTTLSHRTCFTALWDVDPAGELDVSAGASVASRVKGAAACVLMLLSTHREFFEMKDAELAAAATRIARHKLEAAGVDLGDSARVPPTPNATESASARRADRMLREVLCGGRDGSSPSPYVARVVRRMNRFAYQPTPDAPSVTAQPTIVRMAEDGVAVIERAPSPVPHPSPPPDDSDDGDVSCGDNGDCDLEVMETSSWDCSDDDDDDGDAPPDDYFPQFIPVACIDDENGKDGDCESAADGDACPLYHALTTSWLE